MMRQITLDTETTGLDPKSGHRIIEIGCVEMVNRQLTGRRFHTYLNPERAVDKGALQVHGLNDEFLSDKPLFSAVIESFLQFIEGADELIIHNAPFDVGFLDEEFRRLKHKKKFAQYSTIFDTLDYARRKHPGQRNNLDALCKRYAVQHFERSLHGALLDAEILAHLYLAMTGGQTTFDMGDKVIKAANATGAVHFSHEILQSNAPIICATPEELARHEAWMEMAKSQ
jgi:DNA polymerase-3 subunit epsilon